VDPVVIGLFGTLATFAVSGAGVLIAAGLRFTKVAESVQELAVEVKHLAESLYDRSSGLDDKIDRVAYELTHNNDGSTVKGSLASLGHRITVLEKDVEHHHSELRQRGMPER